MTHSQQQTPPAPDTAAPPSGPEPVITPDALAGFSAVPRTRAGLRNLIVVFIILCPAVLWQTAQWSRAVAIDQLHEEGRQRLAIYRSNLQSELEKYEFQPLMLAREMDLVKLLAAPEDIEQRDWVNRRLGEINDIAKTSAMYLMDVDGNTLASSNWNTKTSFVGKNFGFRPYFKEAITGRSGRYFALGTTSGKPGYYLSHPVSAAGITLGVAVVKVSVARIELDWAAADQQVIVTDQDGVVFIASDDNWKFKTLAPLESSVRQKLLASRKYANSPLEPLSLDKQELLDGGSYIATIDVAPSKSRVNSPDGTPQTFLVMSEIMPGTQWRLHLLSQMWPVSRVVAYSLLLATLGLAIAFMIWLYVAQRRIALKDRLDLENLAHATLQQANDRLERRVEARTYDLEASNRHLQREIGERRKAEDELRQAQDELIQASKLAALGQMAAGITHELNQPLAAIRTYSDNAGVFLDRGRADEAKSNLVQISDLTMRMAEITSQLKAYSRKTEAKLEPVSVMDAVKATVSMLRGSGKLEGVEVINTATDPSQQIMGEAVRLEQVLINLLHNAVDAMEQSPVKRLEIIAVEKSPYIHLKVRDTGHGIAAENRTKIFDPFFSTKEVGQGLGLGLSITYRIVKDFGGIIRTAPHLDGGTEFTIVLKSNDTSAPMPSMTTALHKGTAT